VCRGPLSIGYISKYLLGLWWLGRKPKVAQVVLDGLHQLTSSQLLPLTQGFTRLLSAEDVRHRPDVEEVRREVDIKRPKRRVSRPTLGEELLLDHPEVRLDTPPTP
ncbi:MAG: hypothetical protein J07HQW1_02010, partial [Haloquadratum walsbyi J07HQW1]